MRKFSIKLILLLTSLLLIVGVFFIRDFAFAATTTNPGYAASTCPSGFQPYGDANILNQDRCCESGTTNLIDSHCEGSLTKPMLGMDAVKGYCEPGDILLGEGEAGCLRCFKANTQETIQNTNAACQAFDKEGKIFLGCKQNATVFCGGPGLDRFCTFGGTDNISEDRLYWGTSYGPTSGITDPHKVDLKFCVGSNNGIFADSTTIDQCVCDDGTVHPPVDKKDSSGNVIVDSSGNPVKTCDGQCVTNGIDNGSSCDCPNGSTVSRNSSGNCTGVCSTLLWNGVTQTNTGGGAALSNDPVGCDAGTGANSGVWTAIGCIPTESTALTNWAVLFGMAIGTLLSVAKIVQGSIMIMTGTGNPDKLQEGKSTITAAVIGLIVIFSAVLLLYALGMDILDLDRFGFTTTIRP